MHPCQNDVTYGVITIFYENPIIENDSESDQTAESSSIVVLSGFTGIATFGLAELLAGENKADENQTDENKTPAEKLKEHLRKHENKKPIQVLVKVEYDKKEGKSVHESREFKGIHVEDVQPLKKITS